MSSKSASNGSVKIEFVCSDCKEGTHGCAGRWTGLGLAIFCTCTCTIDRNKPDYKNSSLDYGKAKTKDAGLSAWLPGTTRRAKIAEDNSTVREVLSSD